MRLFFVAIGVWFPFVVFGLQLLEGREWDIVARISVLVCFAFYGTYYWRRI